VTTVDYILDRYSVEDAPIVYLPHSRFDEYPRFLADIGARRGVEVGVLKGLYCERLCSFIPGLDLTGVDAWEVYPGYHDYSAETIEAGRVEAYERSRRVGFKLIRAWSMDAVRQFEDNSLDFVFLDAGHDFRSVASDISEWSRKVKPGGIVSGHDFCLDFDMGFEVKPVVLAWCETKRIRPLFVWNIDKWHTWMYVKGGE